MLATATREGKPSVWRWARAPALVTSLGVSAFGMSHALGSPGHAWVGWVVLLPLFVSIRQLPPIKAMLAGSFWGLSLFVFLILANAPENGFAGSAVSLAVLTTVPGLYTYLGARLTRQIGFSPYLLALGWMGVELAISPLGLRSGLLAGTQGNGVVILWLGDFAGSVLVAFLVACVSAAVFEALRSACAGAATRVFVTTARNTPQRLAPQESFSVLSHLIHPTQPRAPPMGLSPTWHRAG